MRAIVSIASYIKPFGLGQRKSYRGTVTCKECGQTLKVSGYPTPEAVKSDLDLKMAEHLRHCGSTGK